VSPSRGVLFAVIAAVVLTVVWTATIELGRLKRTDAEHVAAVSTRELLGTYEKAEGKNNFQFYSEKLNAHSLERLTFESSLRHAEFRLLFADRGEITCAGKRLGLQHG
jgi:hypothetical protein